MWSGVSRSFTPAQLSWRGVSVLPFVWCFVCSFLYNLLFVDVEKIHCRRVLCACSMRVPLVVVHSQFKPTFAKKEITNNRSLFACLFGRAFRVVTLAAASAVGGGRFGDGGDGGRFSAKAAGGGGGLGDGQLCGGGISATAVGAFDREKTADPASRLQPRTAPEWNRMCQ